MPKTVQRKRTAPDSRLTRKPTDLIDVTRRSRCGWCLTNQHGPDHCGYWRNGYPCPCPCSSEGSNP